MAEMVTLKQAAVTLGKSEQSIRRCLKLGWLEGERVRTPAGDRWLVALPDDGVIHPPESVALARQNAAASGSDLERLYAVLDGMIARREQTIAELRALREALPEPVSTVSIDLERVPAAAAPAPEPLEPAKIQRPWWARLWDLFGTGEASSGSPPDTATG